MKNFEFYSPTRIIFGRDILKKSWQNCLMPGKALKKPWIQVQELYADIGVSMDTPMKTWQLFTDLLCSTNIGHTVRHRVA